jgi:hypothetical protein
MNNDKMIMKLDKELYNLNAQNEAIAVILEAITAYGDKTYNKRFATFTNKLLIERFGSKMYERYGRESEEVGNVYCYLTTDEFIKKHTRFNMVYKGKEIRSNYTDNDRTEYLGESNEHELFYGSDTLPELTEALNARVAYNIKNIDKIKGNKKSLNSLIKEHDKVAAIVSEYNDKITYVLSDDLRIK